MPERTGYGLIGRDALLETVSHWEYAYSNCPCLTTIRQEALAKWGGGKVFTSVRINISFKVLTQPAFNGTPYDSERSIFPSSSPPP